LAFNFKGNTNKDKKWPGMKIWNFANFFTEDVKKNHIFPQIFSTFTPTF
jgi:hypothetical protein